MIDPVSEAEQLSSTSERWEGKVLDIRRVGVANRLRAVSLELGVRLRSGPELVACQQCQWLRQIALRKARIVEYFSIGFIALLTRPRNVVTRAGALEQAYNGAVGARWEQI